MRFLLVTFAALTFILTCGVARSQTLHYISVAETADVQLPKEFAANKAAFDGFISSISNKDSNTSISGLKLHSMPLEAKDFNCETILSTIDSFELNQPNDDVIIFFYSGHGQSPKQYAQDPNTSDYPKLLCGKSARDPMPTLEKIFDKLKSKNARLLIVGADSCNNLAAPPAFESEAQKVGPQNQQIHDLLRNYHGYLLISSAKPQEFAFYRDHSLGYFTKRFLDVLAAPSPSHGQDVWDAVLTKATLVIDIPDHKQLPDESPKQRQQHPLFRKELSH